MREIEDPPGKEASRLHSEKQASPRRGNPKAAEAVLSGGQSERDGEGFWDTEQLDGSQLSRWSAGIARQPFLP